MTWHLAEVREALLKIKAGAKPPFHASLAVLMEDYIARHTAATVDASEEDDELHPHDDNDNDIYDKLQEELFRESIARKELEAEHASLKQELSALHTKTSEDAVRHARIVDNLKEAFTAKDARVTELKNENAELKARNGEMANALFQQTTIAKDLRKQMTRIEKGTLEFSDYVVGLTNG